MKNATAMRALGLAPPLCCAAAFAVLVEGALIGTERDPGDAWVYGYAAALLMVAGWTQIAETRLQQLVTYPAQRRLAGKDTFRMLRILVPVAFAVTQLLLVLMVAMMTHRIDRQVANVFMFTTMGVVGLSAAAGAWHHPILRALKWLKRLFKRMKH